MQQLLDQEQDVLTYLLTTLVGGALDDDGEQMLADVFNITTANLNQLTPQGWAAFGDRAIQAKWFLDHISEIKEKFKLLIDAQICFREFQGWLMEAGYKGAEKIKKAQIDVAVARAKYGATVEQQDYRLTKNKEQFAAETVQENLLWDNTVIAAIAKKVAEVDAATTRMQGNPEFAAQLAKWKEEETNIYKQAAYGLKHGTHGLSHPSLNPSSSSQVQISQSNFSQPQFISAPGLATTRSVPQATATGRAKDSINVAVNWSGDMAGKVNGVASQINRGFSRFSSFFRGGN
ncbi:MULTISPECIES: hypothetical protein [unclassified Microcoleus]|uniref:hypothetical protein n=1 Tax=unclassified Microcoleus TaxID=2642155 RepID=UPI002FD08BD8